MKKLVPKIKLLKLLKLSLVCVCFAGLVCALGNLAQAQTTNTTIAWTPWTQPKRVLPYAGTPQLIINPLNGTATYVTASLGYGIVSGNEFENWQTASFLKLGDHAIPENAQLAKGIYDEYGTLHVAWGGRTPDGFNIFYNRVLKGTYTNNVGVPRNLTQELYGTSKPDGYPMLAYSRAKAALYLIFIERGDDSGQAPDILWFSQSTDQGQSWSMPTKLGTNWQGNPPALVVDKAGNAHVFYTTFDGNRGGLYHVMLKGSDWSSPEEITGGKFGRVFNTSVAASPNGDVWVSWVAGETHAARWNSTNGQWQSWEALSGKGTSTGWATIAVGEGTGAVWVIWTDKTNGEGKELRVMFTVSHDGGNTWLPAQLGFVFGEQQWNRASDISATSARGLIHLALTESSEDPTTAQGWTMFVSSVPEVWPNTPPNPTTPPNPAVSATPTNVPPILSPTATLAPVAPTATPTIAAPAVVASAPTLLPQPSVTPAPTATVLPTATLEPYRATATAYTQAQIEAARTPQIITLPTMAIGAFSGRGPQVMPATATPNPTATALPTATAAPTATARVAATLPPVTAQAVVTGTNSITTTRPTKTELPASPPPIWLVPLGLALSFKGLLNLLAFRGR